MPFNFLKASKFFIWTGLPKILLWHVLYPSYILQLWLPFSSFLPTYPIPNPPSQSPLFTSAFLLPPFDNCPSTGSFHPHYLCFLDPHSCAMSFHISLSFPLSWAPTPSGRLQSLQSVLGHSNSSVSGSDSVSEGSLSPSPPKLVPGSGGTIRPCCPLLIPACCPWLRNPCHCLVTLLQGLSPPPQSQATCGPTFHHLGSSLSPGIPDTWEVPKKWPALAVP